MNHGPWRGICLIVMVLSIVGAIISPAAGITPLIGFGSPIAAASLAVALRRVRKKCSPVESMEEIAIHFLTYALLPCVIILILHGIWSAPESNILMIVQCYFLCIVALWIGLSFLPKSKKEKGK